MCNTSHKSKELTGPHMPEVAPMAIGTASVGAEHAANLGLVAGVTQHRPQLLHAVCKPALVPIGAIINAGPTPLVAQLSFLHPLGEDLHFHLQFSFLTFLLNNKYIIRALQIRWMSGLLPILNDMCQIFYPF